MNGLPEADAREVAPAPVAENLMVYLDAAGHVWARNPSTGIARHLTGRMPPVEDYLLVDGTRPMLGLLTLVALQPVDPFHATPKDYVDARHKHLQDQIDLLLAGQVFIGSYDVVNDFAVFINSVGLPSGPLPPASTFLAGHYVICITAGLGNGEAPPDLFGVGDQIFSDGTDWVHVKVGGPIVTAMQVAIVPEINAWADVQAALDGLWTGKLDKAGGVMTGPLYLPLGLPVSPDQAVSKGYVDGRFVVKTGDIMTGPLMLPDGAFDNLALSFNGMDMGFWRAGGGILNVRVGINLNALSINAGGISVPGIDMGTIGKIIGLADPVNPQDGANKRYVDARVLKTGDAMTGNLQIAPSGSNVLPLNLISPAAGIPALQANRDILIQNGNVVCSTDGMGLTLTSARLYKMSGGGVVFRKPSGGPQFQIEENNGSQRVNIATVDGMDMIAVRRLQANDWRGGAGMVGLALYKTDTTVNNVCPAVEWRTPDNHATALIRGRQTGGWSYYTNSGSLEAYQTAGGYSLVRIFYTRNNAWTPDMMFEGTVYARGSALTSDASLKSRIAPPDPDDVEKAFAALRPVRFHWAPPQIDNPLAAPDGKSVLADPDPDRLEWGFLAQDIEVGIPDAIHDAGEGKKAYELANVVAVLTAKIKRLEEQLEVRLEQERKKFEAVIQSFQEQLDTLEERFSNMAIAEMESQISMIRERAGKANQLRRPKPPQLPET